MRLLPLALPLALAVVLLAAAAPAGASPGLAPWPKCAAAPLPLVGFGFWACVAPDDADCLTEAPQWCFVCTLDWPPSRCQALVLRYGFR